MDGVTVEVFLKSFAILSAFLLLGMVLRAKVGVFQKLYLPASVIGGTIALILGPNVLGLMPLSEDIMGLTSNFPAKLFGLVIAAMPMCASKLKKEDLKTKMDIWTIAGILCLLGAAQVAIGLAVNVVSRMIGHPTYAGFGTEMFMGFCGGHGLGAIVGSYFQGLGQDYWETAQGIAMSCATVGLVGGIISGTIVINYAIRKGKTRYVKNAADISEDMRTGLYQPEIQPQLGKETTNPGAIDTLTLHFGLILLAVGAGYVAYYFVHLYNVPFLRDFDSWVFMLIAMYAIWAIVRELKLDKYFNEGVKNRIQGALTDYIVVAAIMTMPLDLVLQNFVPLAASCLIGIVVTVFGIWILSQKLMTEDPAEKAMGPMGMMTGDFITGVLLLKMVDPEMKSNALSDFSIAYAINTFYSLALLAFIYPFIVNHGAGASLAVMLVQVVVFLVLTIISGKIGLKLKGKKG